MTQCSFEIHARPSCDPPPHRTIWFMRCDQCGTYGTFSHWVHPPLDEYRALGWVCSKGTPVRDLCPTCAVGTP